MATLEQLMTAFLVERLECESIDHLPLTADQKAARKADFFRDERSIVIEVKSLVESRETKVAEILERERARPDWPLFQGELGIRELLSGHPRGTEIRHELFAACTLSVQRAVASANEQIGDTKRTFGLGESMGVLVVLNEGVDILDPRIVGTIRKGRHGQNKDELKTSPACLSRVSGVPALTGSAAAQWDPYGSRAPTTPGQQVIIISAQDFLTSIGENFGDVPSITNADLTGALAATNPATGEIGIDFKALEQLVGSNASPSDYPDTGMVVVILFHELQHYHHGWGNSFCQEQELQTYCATIHCNFACFLAGIGQSSSEVCLFYNRIANIINARIPRAQAEGCSGNIGPVTPCGCC